MSVVGFDIGYQSSHVAIARHGGVEIVNNEYSDRKNPTMVAFTSKQRLMGTSAKNQATTNFKNTIWGFRPLLGRKYSDPLVQEELKRLPYQIVQRNRDDIGIKITDNEGERIFAPKQIMAMLLTYLKKVAEKSLGKPVADCVISVPSYFIDSQRRAMLDAAQIAGLNCLRLINDTTAAALAYGIYKQDLPEEKEKPRNVVFVDMGHSALQVVIVAFQKGKLKVLSKDYDPNVGGRLFDERLMHHFSAQFKKKYNIDSLAYPRQTLRLTSECEKLKKSMGTITQPVTISLDCFAEDRDLNGSINRKEHMEMCADILDRVRAPLENALAKSGLSVADIYAVELIGGATRIPAIKEIISNVFKRELSTTLNLDEAVSRGCALQCAMLSPTFKVRDFNVNDIQPYPVKLRWLAAMEGEDADMTIFKAGDLIYHSKMLTFYRRETFDLEATYPEQTPLIYNPRIGTFRIKNVAPTHEGDASKVKVKVRMNIHGIFYIKSASMVEKQVEEELMETDPSPSTGQEQTDSKTVGENPSNQAPPPSSQPPVNEDTTNGQTASHTEPQESEQPQPCEIDKGREEGAPASTEGSMDDLQSEPVQNNGGGEGSSGADSPPTEKKDEKVSKPPESKKAKKPTWKYVDLPVESSSTSSTTAEMTNLREIEVQLNYHDQLEIEKAEARNAVEEYVYVTRDKLDYDLNEFITEQDKESFKSILSSTEDWLYEDGEDQPKKVYVEKLTELKKLGDPVVHRAEEWGQRPVAFNELGQTIIHYEKILEKYLSGDELYNHLEQADMDKVKEQVEGKRAWLNLNHQACTALNKTDNPPVTSVQIRAETKNMISVCDPIVTKAKPKVEPPKDEEKKKEGGEAEGEASTTTENAEKMDDDQPKPAEDQASKKDEDMDLD